jgi:hypothetical protein
MDTLIELPENVVPMPADKRAHVKLSADTALANIGNEVVWSRYFHAVPPEVALTTLVYVEALEAHTQAQARRLSELESQLQQATTVLHPAGPWTEGLEANRQQLQADYFAMKQRAEAAEARATGLQTELAEQEREKFRLILALEARQIPLPAGISPAAPTLVGDETPAPPVKQVGSKFFLNGDPTINPFGQ